MIFLFFVFFLIASAFLVNKYIAFFLVPDLFVGLRMGISGVLLFLIYSCHKETLKNFKENFFSIFIIAIFTTLLPSLLRVYALQGLTATRSSFWGALEPFITAFWAYILQGRSLNRYQLLGCLISLFAMYFFIFMQSKEGAFHGCLLCIADLAQLASLFISRFGWIRGQQLLQKNIFSPQQFNSFSFMISGALAMVSFFARGCILSNYSHCFLNFNFVVAMLYTIIIGNMIAYSLYAYALKNTVVTYISICGLSMPLFVHLLSVLFFNELFSRAFFFSLILIGIALYVFQYNDQINT